MYTDVYHFKIDHSQLKYNKVCVFWYRDCVAFLNHEVVKVVQPRFQPHTEATPVLESG